MMTPELKAEWVAALRSGDYKQARDALRIVDNEKNYSYCCLGVLCDIMPDVEWSPVNGHSYLYYAKFSSGHTSSAYIPRPEAAKLGLEKKIIDTTRQTTHAIDNILMGMNDQGKTFAEIADYIEANL